MSLCVYGRLGKFPGNLRFLKKNYLRSLATTGKLGKIYNAKCCTISLTFCNVNRGFKHSPSSQHLRKDEKKNNNGSSLKKGSNQIIIKKSDTKISNLAFSIPHLFYLRSFPHLESYTNTFSLIRKAVCNWNKPKKESHHLQWQQWLTPAKNVYGNCSFSLILELCRH